MSERNVLAADELRAAAERTIQFREEFEGLFGPFTGDVEMTDCERLARAYLADHPADDGVLAADELRAAAAEKVRFALAELRECIEPNDNADGEWSAKPHDGTGIEWMLLGPRYAHRPARTMVATVCLDSFPDEQPKRAERVATALATLINNAELLAEGGGK